jgi:RNA polymerase sigma-70 factor (ECF subfamily)
MPSSAAVAMFLARVAGSERFAALPRADLEAALAALVTAGRAAWPSVPLDEDTFLAHLTERLPAEGSPSTLLAEARAADLYLACACAEGEPRAHAAFERAVLARARVALASFEGKGSTVEDALQAVREKLLLGEGGERPRIVEYVGAGSLEAWVKVALMRTALNLNRGKLVERPAYDGDVADEPLLGAGDPELDAMKHEHREAFAQALRDSLAGLPVEERNLLRLYLVDRLNIAAIGAIFKVHRATVARWIVDVRSKVLEGTHALLRQRLKVSDSDADSLARLLRSQLDVSVLRMLRSPSS